MGSMYTVFPSSPHLQYVCMGMVPGDGCLGGDTIGGGFPPAGTIYTIQYSILVPSGTLTMYDIVCHSHSHSHSLLFLQYQYYNTTQIQLHQMVKGRRCSGLNKEAMYAVSFH